MVLVDEVDLATLGALAYGRSLRPSDLRAVHFVIDSAHAEEVQEAWSTQIGVRDVPLYLIDCPDRRLARAALELAARESASPGTEVTLLLPRRTYAPSSVVCCTTGQPTTSRGGEPDASRRGDDRPVRRGESGARAAGTAGLREGTGPRRPTGPRTPGPPADAPAEEQHPAAAAPAVAEGPGSIRLRPDEKPEPLPGAGGYEPAGAAAGAVTPIGSLHQPGRPPSRAASGWSRSGRWNRTPCWPARSPIRTGDLTALFYGRSRIPGRMCGSRVRLRGPGRHQARCPGNDQPGVRAHRPVHGRQPGKNADKWAERLGSCR